MYSADGHDYVYVSYDNTNQYKEDLQSNAASVAKIQGFLEA